jgi:hypothetical protein
MTQILLHHFVARKYVSLPIHHRLRQYFLRAPRFI